jgi:putative flippase GtrA
MENITTPSPQQNLSLTKKDVFLVSFIGVSFALFATPILSNLNLPFFKVSFGSVILLIVFFSIFANIAIWIASLIGKKIAVVFQIAKFSAVGAFNTFLDWGIVNLLMALTGIFLGPWYSFFNVLSFLAANSGSYFWNKYWTFSTKDSDSKGGFLQFFGVTLIGLGFKVGIASLVVNVISHPASMTPARWANIGLALGTLFALVWNFVGYKFIVFKK